MASLDCLKDEGVEVWLSWEMGLRQGLFHLLDLHQTQSPVFSWTIQIKKGKKFLVYFSAFTHIIINRNIILYVTFACRDHLIYWDSNTKHTCVSRIVFFFF